MEGSKCKKDKRTPEIGESKPVTITNQDGLGIDMQIANQEEN